MNVRITMLKLLGIAFRLPYTENGTSAYGAFVLDHLNDLDVDGSADKIETALITELIRIIKEVIRDKKDLGLLTAEIATLCKSDVDYGEDIITNLTSTPIDDEMAIYRQVMSEIASVRRMISNVEITKAVANASSTLRFRPNTIPDMTGYMKELTTKIESLVIDDVGKHHGEVDSFDSSDTEKVTSLFEEAKELVNGGAILRTGWKAMNSMMQGGLRLGETLIIPALAHTYKTSGTLSMFRQFCQYNTPDNSEGQCMMVRISFEDSLANNLIFLYKNIIFNETGVTPDLVGVSAEDMSDKVLGVLSKTGYQILFKRCNGNDFSYTDIINVANKCELDGKVVHLLMVDYLLKCNLQGIPQDGPQGNAQRALLERCRDTFAAKEIAFCTPAQLGPRAKSMLSTGVAPQDFLPKIAGQGMTSGSSQLDQIVDMCIYFHIVKVNNKAYLHVLLDKHRLPTIVPASQKSFYLPFPDVDSIPDDVNSSKGLHVRSLNATAATADDMVF